MSELNVDIIVVDDNPEVGELIQAMLEDEPVSVETFTSSQEALIRITEKKPKIAILDYNMPGLTGQELIVKLSENMVFKDTSIILISGESFSEIEKIRFMTLGFERIFEKPISRQDLLDYVYSVIPKEISKLKVA